MGVGAGFYMFDVVVKKFTFAISSPDEFLLRSVPLEGTEFGEITLKKDHYAIQGHSRSPILISIENSLYDFLLVINANLPHILHRFRDIAFDRSKIAIFGYPFCI